MSEAKFQKLVASLRERLENNPQVPDEYAGDLIIKMAQGGLTQVWTNGQVLKAEAMTARG